MPFRNLPEAMNVSGYLKICSTEPKRRVSEDD